MKPIKRTIRKSAGFNLVEVIICITVTAFLMTAAAIALKASADSCDVNRDISTSVNSAIQALSRITSQLRTASAVEASEPNTQCTLITSGGADITYSFEGSQKKLYLITNDDTSDDNYVVCGNVTNAAFIKTTAVDDANMVYVRSVQITLTVSVGSYTNTVAAAASVRKNL